MLNDLHSNVEYVKEIGKLIYGEDVFFYDYNLDVWYSKCHSRNIKLDEALDWIRENISTCFCEKLNYNIGDIREDKYKFLLKYRNPCLSRNWTYFETVDELELFGIIEKLELDNSMEYEVYKKIYNTEELLKRKEFK